MNSKINNERFVLCVRNKGHDDLVARETYRLLADENAAVDGFVRIVDESGEDYLYPADCFASVDLSASNDEGIHIEKHVLSSNECSDLINALSNSSEYKGRAGTRHLMRNPAVALIAKDERLLSLARRFVGPGAVPYRATLFEKSGYANWLVVWHQDTALPLRERFESTEWGPWSSKAGIVYSHAPSWALSKIVALRIHLDDSTEMNGPLRVVPRSHLLGVLDDEALFEFARRHQPVECLASQGTVVCMRPLLIHASSKARNDSPRRVLHIEYAENLELAPGINLAMA